MCEPMTKITDIFGSNVFSDAVMRERLPKNIYKSFNRVLEGAEDLTPAVADVMANAMKDWAIEKGATHFCHWFQPMTGLTAEKHDSFISPTPQGRLVVSVGRASRDVRGPWLYGMGLHVAGVHQGRRQEHHAVYSQRVLFVHGRGAR